MRFPASLVRTLGFAGLYVAATYAGRRTVMDDTNLSLVWPAAGVSAVWFLAQSTSRWRWLDVLALSAVTMVVNTSTGASRTLAAFFVLANLAQAFVFVALFRRWLPHLWGGGGDQPLARLRELWRLVAVALLGTTAGALIGPTGIWLVNGAYSWAATAVWMTRNTVSILLIGVAGIRLGQLLHRRLTAGGHRPVRLRERWSAMPVPRRFEYVIVTLLSAGGYYGVFGIDHRLPLAFAVLVMTVWAGLRLHTGFVILHDLTFGTVTVLFTLHNTGVFATVDSNAARALVAQLFVGMVSVVGLALALGRDERTALVDALTAERQAAGDQARLMGAIVDSMTEGLTVVDPQGRYVLRNPASRDLLGSDTDRYGLAHPDGTPLATDEMPYRRALAGLDVRGLELLVRNPEVPGTRVLSVSSTALPGELNGSRCAVTVFHDVTAERRHRDELASFAGVVAHDLLNPLAIIEGMTGLLTEVAEGSAGTTLDDETLNGLLRIARAASRMHHLIDDMLAYTTARDAAIDSCDISLTGVVTDIATDRIDQARSARRPVPQIRIDELAGVHADPVLVRQLLENLISNAIKYTALGVTPRIEISSSTGGGMTTVTIVDNGIGIPAGQHQSIFDNFTRAHRNDEYAGTGLGLGICRRIVDRHGGTIAATDNPGGGSRFVFTLPLDLATAMAEIG
ncbi:ATP-binding protein [Micromonosporaceae bacterium Da 78-11]